MALIEQKKIDKIEIVGDFKHIQVRECIEIVDDTTNEVKAQNYHRTVVMCGDDAKAAEFGVDNITAVLWTPEIREAWEIEKTKQI